MLGSNELNSEESENPLGDKLFNIIDGLWISAGVAGIVPQELRNLACIKNIVQTGGIRFTEIFCKKITVSKLSVTSMSAWQEASSNLYWLSGHTVYHILPDQIFSSNHELHIRKKLCNS